MRHGDCLSGRERVRGRAATHDAVGGRTITLQACTGPSCGRA
ncbi:hypothetical protein FM113_11695 [Leucobacter sp. 7(1)]|nr:hypothetical protein FM113_11695 [Leucobacter sp. 7(1)]